MAMYSHRCSRLVAWKLLAGGLLELPKEVKVGGLELVSVQPGHSLQGRFHCGHEENEVRKVPTERVLPVVWGPRTHARAAAPLTGVGTGVGGVAALGCSSDTDPIKVHIWPQEGLNLVPASCERRLGTGERSKRKQLRVH